jgi:membrane-associated phospholipid phosphatase
LVAISATAAALVLMVYGFAVRTHWGQSLDAAAVRGRRVLSPESIRVAARVHTTISVASLAIVGSAIIGVALVRGRPRLAIAAAALIVASVATTEALKRLLDRPRLGVQDIVAHAPSYPSGHTTVAFALALSAAFVVPGRFRALVAVVGALFASAIGVSVVITASHRPSDPIGAALVVVAWAAAVSALLLRTPAERRSPRPTWAHLSPWVAIVGIVFLAAAATGAALTVLGVHYGAVRTVHIGRAFIFAASAIVGTILTCTAALLLALHDAPLDRRPTSATASTSTNPVDD